MSSREPEVGPDLDDPAGVLAWSRDRKAVREQADRDVVIGAAAWAALHSAETLVTEADWIDGRERALPLGGAGCPEVAEYAVPELAAALGMSTDAGRRFLGEVVELRYRLPRLWAALQAGEVAA